LSALKAFSGGFFQTGANPVSEFGGLAFFVSVNNSGVTLVTQQSA
jgi:hypothetical protein